MCGRLKKMRMKSANWGDVKWEGKYKVSSAALASGEPIS